MWGGYVQLMDEAFQRCERGRERGNNGRCDDSLRWKGERDLAIHLETDVAADLLGEEPLMSDKG